MLTVSIGRGLDRFLLPKEISERQPPAEWEILSIALDQGSDGWSATSFLGYGLPFGVHVQMDPSHRCWNDCQLALKDTAMWAPVNLMTVVLNMDAGPWRDARWYKQACEAVETYTRHTDPAKCPMWQVLFHRIVADRGEQMLSGSPGYEESLFQGLGSAWATMSAKIGMSRWFAWMDSAERLLTEWHSRLLALLFMCVSMGVMAESHSKMLVKGLGSSSTSLADQSKASTQDEPEVLKRLRRACKNTAHLAVVCLSDQYLWELFGVIVYVFRPVRLWHADQSQRVRSVEANLQWATAQALGAGFVVVQELAQRVGLAGPLRHLGLGGVAGLPIPLDVAHPAVLNDDSIAERTMSLTLNTMARRLASHMVYSHGLPEVFAGLLDVNARPGLLLWLVEVYQSWQAVKRRQEKFWAKVISRSPFNLVAVDKAPLVQASTCPLLGNLLVQHWRRLVNILLVASVCT